MINKGIISLLIIFLLFECFSGSAQTFKYRQVQTDDVCLLQLMENITKVIYNSNLRRDATCHFLSLKEMGTDTLLEIHSLDSQGIYKILLEHESLSVCIMFGHEFYIDTSIARLFYNTEVFFKKKYSRKIMKTIGLTFNDSYYYWLFKKVFCGIDLDGFWCVEDFKDWYSLELNTDCFCDYKKMSIELIEEDSEEINEIR